MASADVDEKVFTERKLVHAKLVNHLTTTFHPKYRGYDDILNNLEILKDFSKQDICICEEKGFKMVLEILKQKGCFDEGNYKDVVEIIGITDKTEAKRIQEFQNKYNSVCSQDETTAGAIEVKISDDNGIGEKKHRIVNQQHGEVSPFPEKFPVLYNTTKETRNFARLSRALIDLCSHVLRDILLTLCKPHDIKERIKSSLNSSKTVTISPEDLGYIKNASDIGSYHKFDITLLYRLIRTLSIQMIKETLHSQIGPQEISTAVKDCPALVSDPKTKLSESEYNQVAVISSYDQLESNLLHKLYIHLCASDRANIIHPTSFWGDHPDGNSKTIGDDIERIRILRNKIYAHLSATAISDLDFSTHCDVLRGIMTRMDKHLANDIDYTIELDNILVMSMDFEIEGKYLLEIEKLAHREQSLEMEVVQLTKNVQVMNENMTRMQTDLREMDERHSQIETEMKTLEQKKEDRFNAVSNERASERMPETAEVRNRTSTMCCMYFICCNCFNRKVPGDSSDSSL